MAITQIGLVGDSLTAGTIYSFNTGQGGSGSWVEQVAVGLGALGTWGPLLSPGIRLTSGGLNFFVDGEWTFTGTFGGGGANDWASLGAGAWNKLPFGFQSYGSGSTKVATYHVTATTATSVVGFDVWWVDYSTNAATNPWSYRIDGGAWTACPDAPSKNNTLRKFYVASGITSTVEIRCADTGGTAAGCFPAAITPYFVDPRSATSGVIINNYAANGQVLHDNFTTPSGGDQMACIDSAVLGSGSPISSTPNLTALMHINDVSTYGDTNQWDVDCRAYINRVKGYGPTVIMSPWEGSTGTYPIATQAAYRARSLVTADAVGAKTAVYDFYRNYAAEGLVGNAAVSTPYLADTLHLNQAGHNDVAKKVLALFVYLLTHTRHNSSSNTGKSSVQADNGISVGSAAW